MDALQFWIAIIEVPIIIALFLMIDRVQRRINCVSAEVKDYKVHVAETYVSKADMEKMMDQVLSRLKDIDRKIDRFRPAPRTLMDD